MLSSEENELITRTGAGSPMGRLARRYWLPALSEELPEPDGAPVRVKLMGGEHADWDDYRRAMERERRVLIRIRIERTGPRRSG